MRSGKMRCARGFTLVELLIVVLILAALATIAVPRIIGAADSAKINACKANVKIINRQIELYEANTGSWPKKLENVTENLDYFPDGPPQCPFGEKYKMRKEEHRIATNKHDH